MAVNVRDYGAKGDGSSADAAILAALDAAASTSGPTPNQSVHFPAGVYLVSSGVLSHRTRYPRSGMVFTGEGKLSSVLLLADGWLYDNAGTPTLERASFHSLCFRGVSRSTCNGFKLTDNQGFEKQFSFWDCRFESLGVCLQTEGATNADECSFIACELNTISTAVVLNNPQSVAHRFDACRFAGVYQDLIVVKAGGEVRVTGESVVMTPADNDVDRYLIRLDNAKTGVMAGRFTFRGVRLEMRGRHACIANADYSSPPIPSRIADILFDDCNFATAQSGPGGPQTRLAVLCGPNRRIAFHECYLPTLAARNDTFTYASQGTVEMTGCRGTLTQQVGK